MVEAIGFIAFAAFCEFLPVSSSAHFWILQMLTTPCFPRPSVPHVAPETLLLAHFVPLLILLIYFLPVWLKGGRDLLLSVKRHQMVGHAKVLLCVALSVLPLVVVGAWKYFSGWDLNQCLHLTRAHSIGVGFVIFGTLFFIADRWCAQRKSWTNLGVRDALVLGVLQCLSLWSGASRLGIVLTGARVLGYGRKDALTLGFLSAVPVLLGAQVLHMQDTWCYYTNLPWGAWVILVVASVMGLVCGMMMARGKGYAYVALYRVIVGVIILMLR